MGVRVDNVEKGRNAVSLHSVLLNAPYRASTHCTVSIVRVALHFFSPSFTVTVQSVL